MRRWKVAISLAAVAAVAAPFVFGTWKHQPTSEMWIPLTEAQRQRLESYLKERNYCRNLNDPNLIDQVCAGYALKPLKEGGEWITVSDPHPFKYLALNLVVVIVGYAGIFGLAMVLPTIVRWLRTIVLR